ncbi:dipeptidase PepE [Verticiella sediminum]
MLSNSSSDAGYLVHALDWIRPLVPAPAAGPAVFVPFAGVTRTWDAYEALVAQAMAPLGCELRSLHRAADARAELARAALVIVGGGNTFNLLHHVRRLGLLEPLRARVRDHGLPYLGWSAGANLACPTIRTTNDMPIIDPAGFDALGLVPWQINAHYTDAHPPGHRGETRRQRLAEFCQVNPDTPVLGLPEGTGLRIEGAAASLLGHADAYLFRGQSAPQALPPGRLELPV